jgi:pimeloyl-ACP methyl ester carboxylesterase
MRIARHFVDVTDRQGRRRVQYRVAGSGPPIVLIHQSPRSSAEWEPLMRRWAREFTVIAPDTPGFGDSGPLAIARPECADYADALLALFDALGLDRVAAYGFHSGAIIAMTALARAPHRFRALVCGGYAVWTAAEQADFGARYTPPFLPTPYGDHLIWLWGRLLEQSWFFPWYRVEPAARLPRAHADPTAVHAVVMECLAAGNSFSLGYAAVLRAPRDLPPPESVMPPVLIAAYDGDPLQAHLERLGPLPAGWEARAVPTPDALAEAARAWLRPHATGDWAPPPGPDDEGHVAVAAGGFDGLVHWRGAGEPWLPAPGGAASCAPDGMLAIDWPGHGLSDGWPEAPADPAAWRAVADAAFAALGAHGPVRGEGWSAMLADRGERPAGAVADWRAQGLPDRTPRADGAHLVAAWRAARNAELFDPWFLPSAASARAFDPANLEPSRLALRHLALMRASAAQPLLEACLDRA